MFYVYVLRSEKDHNLYIGYTDNLCQRLAEHNNGESKATKSRIPLHLVYYEAYASQTDAKAREQRLKPSAGANTTLKRRLRDSLR